VKPGQLVAAGQRIGWTGTTGNAAKSANKPGGEAMSKLRDHGARVYPNAPRVIDIGACWSPDSDGYWLSFEFDGNGRLSKVEQGYQAY
jgi:hypothetical protein